ncbi:MAG: hypothetical protein QXG65_03825 [Thermoplasmata archaeon]
MSRTGTMAVALGILFLIATALAVTMLLTDTNLRTNFGTLSSGYYLHWYAVLAMAAVSVLGAGLLIGLRSRATILGSAIGSGLLALAMVADIATYAEVGFSSASSFAQYLFGITYYGGDIRYLFDVLLATYLVTFGLSLAALAWTRASRPSQDSGPAAPAP